MKAEEGEDFTAGTRSKVSFEDTDEGTATHSLFTTIDFLLLWENSFQIITPDYELRTFYAFHE